MSDFFTSAEKLEFSNLFNDLHDTFAYPIYIFKQRDELVITDNPNHSYVWDNAPTNTQTTSTLVSGTFNARILYGKTQEKNFVSTRQSDRGEDQIGAETFGGDVRLKLDPTGAAFIADAQMVRFNNDLFTVSTETRHHGLFGPNKWQTFYLKKAN
jgi:hypothetical protein